MTGHPRAATALRLVVSAACAVALAGLVMKAATRPLDVETDIVGYPTFANYDPYRNLWAYLLAALVVPLATLAIYVGLTRMLAGHLPAWRPPTPPVTNVETVAAPGLRTRALATAASRLLLVGAVLGLEIAMARRVGIGVAGAVAVAYALLVAVAGAATARFAQRSALEIVACLNTLLAPAVVAGLAAASSATEVTVASTGTVHEYDWLPAWVALGGAALLVVALGVALARGARRNDDVARLERIAVALVVAPVGVFLLTASLPGALGSFDAYEDGQGLAGATLVQAGSFPWRDVLLTHGLLFDVGRGIVGFSTFENSDWGFQAGQAALLQPLAWVAVYYLCAYLFWSNWLYLVGTQLLAATGAVVGLDMRFTLVPVVALLLAACLREPHVLGTVVFTALLAVQIVVTPEALTAGVAFIGTIVAFEAYYYERGRGLLRGFQRTVVCLASAFGLAALWAAFLLANGALDDWWFSFTTLLPGHFLTGGIPLLVPKTAFEVVAPVCAIVATLAFFAVRTLRRQPLAYRDWVGLALAGLAALYYPKFLGRPDRYHLEQAYGLALPLVFYVAYRAITFGEAAIAASARRHEILWVPARHTLTLPLVLVLLAGAPVPLRDVADSAPSAWRTSVPDEPEIARVGFTAPGEVDARALREIAAEVAAELPPGGRVFDFTNSPGLFHFLAEFSPATRYYHVSLAIRERSQSDLVRRLADAPPDVVVVPAADQSFGLSAWDGVTNQVRHYDVSRYLFEHFVPVRRSDGYILLKPRASAGTGVPELYFAGPGCDWGYVPNFFSPGPEASAPSVRLPQSAWRNGTTVLTLPPGASGYGWLVLRAREPLQEGTFALSDRRGFPPQRSIAFKTLARDRTEVRVKVGACSQWYGYGPGPLYLRSDPPQAIAEARLSR